MNKTKLRIPVNGDDHVQGDKNAPLELVEYGDYQCPFCSHADVVVKRLQGALKSQLFYVFRNFPLAQIHPRALDAAKATLAAGHQGKFWNMHDILYENQEDLDGESLLTYARALNLNLDRFVGDFNNPDTDKKIMSDFYGGVRSGVTGTPTFFINGHKYEGDWSFDSLLKTLKGLLTKVS